MYMCVCVMPEAAIPAEFLLEAAGQRSVSEKSSGYRRIKRRSNIGALMIRIRFRGPLYYNGNKEPLEAPIVKTRAAHSFMFAPLRHEL